MQDENFRKFMAHPKVQEVFRDPEVVEAMKANDPKKITTNPKLMQLAQDPELRDLMGKLDFGKMMS